MSLLKTLRDNALPCKVITTKKTYQVVTKRTIQEPKHSTDVAQNQAYFSEILHNAFQERSALKYCILSLIHYKKEREYLIKDNDYSKTSLFMENDPYVAWCPTYYDGFEASDNVRSLVLKININDQTDQAQLLLAHYKNKKKDDNLISLYIGLECIVSLVFE